MKKNEINLDKQEENLTGKFGDTATYTVKDITGFTYKAEKTTARIRQPKAKR